MQSSKTYKFEFMQDLIYQLGTRCLIAQSVIINCPLAYSGELDYSSEVNSSLN